jgi:cytochrome c
MKVAKEEDVHMRAIKISRAVLGATAGIIGMSIAWLASAATPAGTPADFSRCDGCHSTQAGQNKVGPSLAGVFGRTSGSVPGYTYSAALKNAHLTWDEQTLDKFLQNPGGLVHGTKMFATVPDADTRQRVIAYLKSLSSQSAASK